MLTAAELDMNSTVERLQQISEYIQEFGDPDPWLDKIASYVAIREEVTAADVLTHALELDPRNQSRREGRRVADVLQSMGWRRLVTSRKDASGKSKSVRVWQRPTERRSHRRNPYPQRFLISQNK